jgi:hypothetical protein
LTEFLSGYNSSSTQENIHVHGDRFPGGQEIAFGDRDKITNWIREHHRDTPLLVFDDASGKVTDLDLRGTPSSNASRPLGRPRLGVQSREVTLLPRHGSGSPLKVGGASAALRRLVDEARRHGRSERERQDAAYNFMQALCGDRPGYEEALRALYKGEEQEFFALISTWPEDVTGYIKELLAAGGSQQESA